MFLFLRREDDSVKRVKRKKKSSVWTKQLQKKSCSPSLPLSRSVSSGYWAPFSSEENVEDAEEPTSVETPRMSHFQFHCCLHQAGSYLGSIKEKNRAQILIYMFENCLHSRSVWANFSCLLKQLWLDTKSQQQLMWGKRSQSTESNSDRKLWSLSRWKAWDYGDVALLFSAFFS